MRSFISFCLAGLVAAAPALAEPSHGLAMHGDLKYGPDFANFDYVDPAAPKGGTVRLATTGGFDTLNGFTLKGDAAPGLGGIYDTLMESSQDEPFSMYGLLAETVETPEDRSWVAFTLRPEARFHDGRPVTPEDVIFSFESLKTKGRPFYRFYYGNVVKVEKTAERTIRFTFKEGAENRELPLILGQFPVLPKHWWEGRDFEKTTLEPPLGSGPYRIKAVDPNRSITYERVEDYWARDLPVNKGINNFDVLRYDIYRDANVMVEAFKAGEFDYRAENSSKAWATSYAVPAVKKGLIKLGKFPHQRTAGMQAFAFNLRKPKFQDIRVRRALTLAFDFEWSNTNLFYGQYTRTRSFFDNSELGATGLPGEAELALLEPFREQLPAEVFTKAYEPPKTDGSGNIRRQLREASKLLTDAGYTVQGRQRIGPDGKPLEFEILLVSPLFERISLPYKKNLERLGVAVRVRTVDSAQYVNRIQAFDFDVVVGNWGQSLSPGNEQRDFWTTEAAKREGSRNWLGLQSPVVDALVEKLIEAPDREALVTATRALDRVLQWGHYLVPQWHIDYDRIVYWDRFGRPETTPMRGNLFATWWVDPAKDAAVKAERGK